MPFDTELLEVMPDTITWHAYLGKDAWGNESYEAVGVAVRANVSITTSRGSTGDQQDTSGPEQVITGTVYVPAVGIKPRDKLVLPGGAVKYVDHLTTFRDAPDVGDYVQQIEFKEQK